ncbi:hypothetical protein BC936DRAFT_149862 [Jimgerdemannia flammicorona]|uniref:BAG domain-containing protein n=1 Tax=Jimgerdemannia flammicorona TaxID=994334 RepID=A0A433CZZ5_9FUNG|nr:hypothetical protein BC936DRAFT_149862 [Jimgerdemannia flammicorona]
MYPFYPHNNYYFVQSAEQSRRIPRTFLHNVDLDDYLQLQLLLQQEQERRQLLIEEERQRRRLEEQQRLRLEEEQRLEAALRRLRYCHQESQREHTLAAERRTLAAARAREQQQKRRRLIAQAIAEDEYRRRVAAAIEQRRQSELTRRYREELLKKQREQEEAAKYEEARTRQLANLLKHVFGHQVEADEEGEDVESKEQKALENMERAAWEDYLDTDDEEEQPGKVNATVDPTKQQQPDSLHEPTTSSSPLSSQQTPKQVHDHPEQPIPSKPATTELKGHVVTLQDLLQELLTGVPVNRELAFTQRQPTPPATTTVTSKPSATATHTLSPKPSAAAAPARATPPLTEAEAATKIQRWYKTAHATTHTQAKISQQLRALDDLASRLDAVQQKHEQQVLSRPLSFHDDGRLSPQPENRKFLAYEDEVMQVMLKLDTVDSLGNEVIRDRRKGLVKRAEGMLAAIDAYKQKEWERAASADGEEERKEEDDVVEVKSEVVAAEDVSPVVEQEQIPVAVTELAQEQQDAEAVIEEAQIEVEEKVVDAGVAEPVVAKDTQEEQPEAKQFTEATEQVTTEQIVPEIVQMEQATSAVQEQQTELEQPVADTSVPGTLESALAEALEPHAKHHTTIVEVHDLENGGVARHVEEEEFVVL